MTQIKKQSAYIFFSLSLILCTHISNAFASTTVGECDADFGVSGTRPCVDSGKPICVGYDASDPMSVQYGKCYQCTSSRMELCTASAVNCSNPEGGLCVGCLGDFGATNPKSGAPIQYACGTQALPACVSLQACEPQCGKDACTTPACGDTCVECSDSNTSACTTQKPVCNISAHVCVECLADENCKDPTKPYCSDQKCIGCKADKDCGSPTSGSVCDFSTNTCVPGCKTQVGLDWGNDCPSTAVCVLGSGPIGTCVPKEEPNLGCTGNYGVGGPRPCGSTLSPICLPDGQCVPCDADLGSNSPRACTQKSTPYCDLTGATKGSCLPPCDGDYQTGSPDACKTAALPVCAKSGQNIGRCVEASILNDAGTGVDASSAFDSGSNAMDAGIASIDAGTTSDAGSLFSNVGAYLEGGSCSVGQKPSSGVFLLSALGALGALLLRKRNSTKS